MIEYSHNKEFEKNINDFINETKFDFLIVKDGIIISTPDELLSCLIKTKNKMNTENKINENLPILDEEFLMEKEYPLFKSEIFHTLYSNDVKFPNDIKEKMSNIFNVSKINKNIEINNGLDFSKPKKFSQTDRIMIENIILKVFKNKDIFAEGVLIDEEDLTAEDGLLPALLISALDRWAIIPFSKNGKGGIHVSLEENIDETLLGYKVVGVTSSSPFFLYMAINYILHTLESDSQSVTVDKLISHFRNWLLTHNLNSSGVEDFDVKLALSSHLVEEDTEES